jgi:glycosyltransferase involved in cell wall biosynthesis
MTRRCPLLLYGIFLVLTGLAVHLVGTVALILMVTASATAPASVWYALLVGNGSLVLLGGVLGVLDVMVLLPRKRLHDVMIRPPAVRFVTVVLTALNDEQSVGPAVDDFRAHPFVRRIIVVDNGSADNTAAVARDRGAIVIQEAQRGYGRCVYRALQEGLRYTDTELTLLCEADMTFRAFDIDKFLSYIPHADIVNGTRIVEQLRARRTQLTTFMYYGNFFVGKLLEAKHLGKGTFTDVGTTYKLCRNAALNTLMPRLNPAVNLEFNAHFLDMALDMPIQIVECPITFHARVGGSKGGNVNNRRAFAVGMRMIRGIVFGWPRA